MASQASMVASQAAVIEELRREVAALKERLGRNSGNSGSPPSMDSPDQRGKRHGHGGGKSGRSRGGQPGHKGNSLALGSQSYGEEFIHQFPTHTDNCA